MNSTKKNSSDVPKGNKNVYKAAAFLLVGSLLASGFSIPIFTEINGHSLDECRAESSLSLGEPIISEENGYLRIDLPEETSLLLETGKPVIPVVTNTFSFPQGTTITDVQVTMVTQGYKLDKKVVPSPRPVPQCFPADPSISLDVTPDELTYGQASLYPPEGYSIRTGVGLENGERVIFVDVHCYAQYSPSNDEIFVPTMIDTAITYNPPSSPAPTLDTYDMLIITDEKFRANLQPLVDHKNNIGIKTTLETTQEIYPQYNGRDDAEDIKLAIKDAIEEWGIKFVLLAGGRKGQTLEWYIPERRSNNADPLGGDAWEGGYSTDLYYADIYKEGFVFDDWDSNRNGVIAEFDPDIPEKRDEIDFYPDVYLGRLPFRYTWEADIIVDKIITYENTANESWFKKAFVAAGDTSPPARGDVTLGIYEGEIVGDVAVSYMEGFDVEKLYTSTGTFSNYTDVVNALNKGPGLAFFDGHGSPTVWGNFLPDAESEEEMILGFSVYDIWKYSNGDHLPVVVVGGCHNAQFNITMQNFIKYEGQKPIESMPTDGCSWMLLEEDGGAIASIGNSGYGRGYINEYCTQGLGGWKDPRFFHAYNIQKKNILGEVFTQAIVDYINIIGGVDTDQADRKEIEEWILFGDPSLAIGGITTLLEPINNTNGKKPEDPQDSFEGAEVVSLDEEVPIWEEGTTWTYKIGDVDFTLDEIKGRYIDAHFATGDLRLEVTEVTDTLYKTEIQTVDADISLDINLSIDFEKNPIKITGHVTNIGIQGTIYLDKSNLGITRIEATITGEVDLASILRLSPFLQTIIKLIPNDITINLEGDFEAPYSLLHFPLETNKGWGLPPEIVTLEGTATSPLFRLVKIANTLASLFGRGFLTPEIASLLPVIDIAEVLTLMTGSDEIVLPEIPEYLYRDIRAFGCLSTTQHTVDAGTFPVREISMVRGIGMVYYSPDVGNVIEMRGNFADILPIVDDIYIELMDWEK